MLVSFDVSSAIAPACPVTMRMKKGWVTVSVASASATGLAGSMASWRSTPLATRST